MRPGHRSKESLERDLCGGAPKHPCRDPRTLAKVAEWGTNLQRLAMADDYPAVARPP
jgi:hypothetical protein